MTRTAKDVIESFVAVAELQTAHKPVASDSPSERRRLKIFDFGSSHPKEMVFKPDCRVLQQPRSFIKRDKIANRRVAQPQL
jgi:hypothetical protein